MESNQVPFERRVVFSLASLYAFRMLGLFMLLPVLALYGTQYQNHSPLLLGLAMGAYGFSQAVLQIPFGIWSDRIGRKPVILVGLIIFALGSVVAALADSVYELIAGRFLQGCGAISAAVMALMIDLTSEENRTKAMAMIGASIGVSFSIALVLGPLLASTWGLASIFWLTALLAIVGIYILYQVIPTIAEPLGRRREAGAVPRLLGQTLKHVELLRLNFGVFSLHFILMASFLVVPSILSDQLKIAKESQWLVYFPILVGAFIAMLPFIIMAEKRRQMKSVFLLAIAMLSVMELLLMVTGSSRFATLTALFLFFMAFNLLEATLPSLVSKVAPAGAKGTATGIYSSSQFFGAFCGGAVGGWMLQHVGATGVLAVCAGLGLAWLVIAFFMQPPKFLTSMLFSITPEQQGGITEYLQKIDGVAEVVVIASENTVYLKVDPRKVNRKELTASIDKFTR